jgi:hypothetical protein
MATTLGVVLLAASGGCMRGSSPSSPDEVEVEIQTVVWVDSAGVARMVSQTEIVRPSALVNMLHNLASERELWLKGMFHQSVRNELAEQPWQTGEVSVRFISGERGSFIAETDVTLYRYAWVEDAASDLWYSPGVITEQEPIFQLVGMMNALGQPVSRVAVRSEARAYWPAGADVIETLPLIGEYRGSSGDVVFDYALDVWVDEPTRRPVVFSRFDLSAPVSPEARTQLREAFYRLVDATGVDSGDRMVHIRYHLPILPMVAAGHQPLYDPAPNRRAATLVLPGALLGLALVYRRLRKEAHS